MTGDRPAWPQNACKVFRDAVKPITRPGLLEDAKKLDTQRRFWVGREVLEGDVHPHWRVESGIVELYERVVKPLLGERECAGADCRAVVNQPGGKTSFHLEHDAEALESEAELRTPICNCVLYLTGSDGRFGSHRQAPDVVLEQMYNPATCEMEPERPERAAMVFPIPRHLAVFDGRLPIGLLTSADTTLRVSLVIRFWDRRPGDVSPLDAAVAQEYGIAPAADEEGAPDAPSLDEISGHGMQPPEPATEVDIPCVELSAPIVPEAPPGCAIPVDEAIKRAGARFTGPGAMSAAVLHHTGYMLWPIVQDQAKQMGTGALLVPMEAVDASERRNGCAHGASPGRCGVDGCSGEARNGDGALGSADEDDDDGPTEGSTAEDDEDMPAGFVPGQWSPRLGK
ncbi:unnamed protein product [Pedinophyceae sp. YPF-701]|nr:unnamed protein product [Pedinophyceae sp. YPF-701]